MAIGNPITLTNNVASKIISVTATADQTLFTVTGGYRINQLAVFRNGVRLVNGADFTANDGATVTLLTAANNNDSLEFQVFDTFRVDEAIHANEASQTINGNLTLTGDLTASGNVSVGGSLTYEDVTNVDSVGVVTARSGIQIPNDSGKLRSGTDLEMQVFHDGTNSVVKDTRNSGKVRIQADNFDVIDKDASITMLSATSTGVSLLGDIDVADKIVHTGDTNTAIRFPAADTFTVETAGSERLRVNSSGFVGVNTDSPGRQLTVSGSASEGVIQITNNTSGGTAGNGFELLHFTSGETQLLNRENGAMRFDTNNTERLRIDASGRLLLGTTTEGEANADDLTIATSGHTGMTIRSGTANRGNIYFSDGTSGDAEYRGIIEYNHDGDTLKLGTANYVRATIDSSGRLLVGATSAFDGGSDTLLQVLSTGGARLALARNDTTTAANDSIGRIRWYGNDSDGNYDECARIEVIADADHASTSKPSALTFNTTAASAESPTEAMRIDSSQRITAKAGAIAEIDTLTSASTVTPDFAASCNFTLTLGHNVTLANPSNLTAGQSGSIFLIQDGTGSRTITFGNQYDFAGGTAPTLSTAASSVDRLDYFVRTSSSIHCVVTLAYS